MRFCFSCLLSVLEEKFVGCSFPLDHNAISDHLRIWFILFIVFLLFISKLWLQLWCCQEMYPQFVVMLLISKLWFQHWSYQKICLWQFMQNGHHSPPFPTPLVWWLWSVFSPWWKNKPNAPSSMSWVATKGRFTGICGEVDNSAVCYTVKEDILLQIYNAGTFERICNVLIIADK